METSRATVMPRRRIQAQVENTDMYMWSSTNTWLRNMASRSRYSGRSWCAIVAMEAWSRATCDSRAIVTLSRKRRCTRVLTVRRNQVAVADTPRPTAATRTRPGRWSSTPSPRSIDQSAGGRSRRRSAEDVIGSLFVLRGDEALRLQIEHRLIAAAACHELVVR